jgi:chromosome segregation ATPase
MKIKFLTLSAVALSGLLLGFGFNHIYKPRENLFCQTVQNTTSGNEIPAQRAAKEVSITNTTEAGPASPEKSLSLPNAELSLLRLKDYIKNIEEKNGFLKEKVELLSSLLEAKEKEILKLNEYNVELKNNFSKKEEEQGKMKYEFNNKLQDLNEQLAKKDTQIASLEVIKMSLEAEIQDLNKKLSTLTTSYSSLKSTIQDKLFPMERELDNVRDELKKQLALNESLNKNIADLNNELSARSKEKIDLGDEYAQLQSSKKEVEAELEKAKFEKAQSEDEISELKKRLEELGASYEETKKSVADLNTAVSRKESEKSSQLSNKENEMLNIKDKLAKLGAEKGTLQMSLEDKDRDIRSLKDKVANLESQTAEFQKELVSQKERLAQTAEQLKRTVSLNNALKIRLKSIYAELELQRAEKRLTK